MLIKKKKISYLILSIAENNKWNSNELNVVVEHFFVSIDIFMGESFL